MGTGPVYGEYDAAARYLLARVPGADPYVVERLVLKRAPADLHNGCGWAQSVISNCPGGAAAVIEEFAQSWEAEQEAAREEEDYRRWREAEQEAKREAGREQAAASRAEQDAREADARQARQAEQEARQAEQAERERAKQAEQAQRAERAATFAAAWCADRPGADPAAVAKAASPWLARHGEDQVAAALDRLDGPPTRTRLMTELTRRARANGDGNG